MKRTTILLAASLAAIATSASAEQAKLSGTVTDIFGPRFVLETGTGRVLVELSPRGANKVALKVGEKIAVEGDRQTNQLRAQRVTLADGHAYTTGHRNRTWREYLTGTPDPKSTTAFGPAQAAQFATAAGYKLNGTPTPKDKHFTVLASKDDKSYDLQIFRDGRLDPRISFGAVEAKKMIIDKGYLPTSEAVDSGMKDRFDIAATKDGKAVHLEVMRNGAVREVTVFAAGDAQKLAKDSGYEPVGDPKAVDAHFELLGKKDGKFYQLRANRDGSLRRDRMVDASDPRWGSMVR